MKEKDKELLIKDLSSRLVYRVKFKTPTGIDTLTGMDSFGKCDCTINPTNDNSYDIEDIKPYLFPLSSMTEEQKSYLHFSTKFDIDRFETITPKIDEDDSPMYVDMEDWLALFEWFHKNHIDYRDLIPMGLAEDATNKNIY